MNKGPLFATSNPKIKSQVVESQIMSLVWPYLSLTEKQRSVNHMIMFNDSISKFYQWSAQGFRQGISMFFSICLSKKNGEAIKSLGILKKYVSENKIYFCLIKTSIVSLTEKVIFSFTWFSKSFTVLYQGCERDAKLSNILNYKQDVCILFSCFFFVLLNQFLRNGT